MKWPTYSLGQLCEISTGRTPSRARPEYFGGEHVWVTISDLNDDVVSDSRERITDLALTETNIQPVAPGTVLLGYKLSLGKLGIAGKRLYTNEAIAALPPKSGVPVLNKFLLYALKRVDYLALCHGAVKGNCLNRASLEQIRVPLPPLSEQRRIVEILDQADALRRKRAEADAKAARILPALFYKMFGDPVTNPRAWVVLRIGDFADVQGGLQLTPARKELSLKVSYLRVANIYRDQLDLSEIKLIGATKDEIERTRLRQDDILIVEGHGNPLEIGRSAVWNGSIDPCVHQNHLIRARVDQSKVLPLYISHFLNSSGGRLQLIRSGKTTSGLNTISVGNVKAVKVPVPPLDLQKRYVEKAETVSAAADHGQLANASIDRLFLSLLGHAFSGALTAKWREAHMRELLGEMEEQAKVVGTK
ncbi:MAG: restriction endonuclease subunit S [Nitrospirota bacterium]